MADPKRLQIIKGGLNFAKRLLAPEEVAAARARGLGVPGVDFADPVAPASMRMSEALGNAGAEGKTLNFTEADRSRVFGPNRGGVGFSGLQHYSKPHKKANTVWGFGNTGVAEKKIRQNDPENSLWTTFVGSPTQHRSNSVVIGDAIKEFQKSVKQGVVPVEQIMLMNKRLNELTDQKTGAKVFENGFDLTDPSALSVANTFARRAAVGDVMLGLGVKGPMARLDFKNEFPGTKFVDASNIENILKRETDPDLVNAGTYDVGNRLFVLDGKIIERPDLNEAFPVQVTGTDLGMKFGLVPPDTAMRDFYKARAGRLDKNQQPSPVTYYDLARAEPSQVVDEDYLTFLQKEGYKEGGAVDMEAADARLAQAIQARMAKGGAVDMEAADARLQAAIQARMGGEKVAHMAGGGKLKALGDIAKKFLAEPAPPQKIIQAPSIIIPSKISNVKEAVRQSKGNYGAKRVERAADEIPNLERLYKEAALKQAFEGDNAKALMTMNPADFEKYATGLPTRTVTEPKSFGDKTNMSTEDYLKYLRTLPEGFDDIPFLEINKQEQGLPLMPFISGHEGRHRNRAMAGSGEKAGLVSLFPRAELREGFPRRSQEEYIEALKKELEMTGNLVLPEHKRYDPTDVQRPAIELPDIYAKGGGVHMAGAGRVFKDLVGDIAKKFLADAPQAEALKLAQQRAALPKTKHGLGLPADNTPEQRAAAMKRNTDAYHGSKQDITGAFRPGYDDNLAFVTKSPDFANKWIGKGKMQKRVGDQAKQELKSAEDMYRDMKSKHMDYDSLSELKGDEFHSEYDRRNAIVKAEAEKEFGLQGSPDKIHSTVYPLTVEANKIFNPETDMDVMAEFFAKNNTPQEIINHFEQGNYLVYETKPVVNFLKSKGYDSMRLRESTGDDYPTIAVFNPESIRGRFAAHDPFRRDAATAAAMGVLAPDLMAEEVKKSRGGLLHMADAGRVFKGLKSIGNRLMAGNKVLPLAERDANLQKFLAPSAEKRRMYHGSKNPNIKAFKTRKEMTNEDNMTGHYADERDAVFLSPEPDFTKNFSINGYTDTNQAPTTYPVYVQVERPFDFDNPEHLKQVKETYLDMYHNPESEFYDPHLLASERSTEQHLFNKKVDSLMDDENNWGKIENEKFQDILKDIGFDSFYTRERGTKNLGVYEPNRIKSAISNRGTYDLGESDMSKAHGGLMMAGGGIPHMADAGRVFGVAGKFFKKLLADDVVNGIKVRKDIPNQSSIGASLNDYSIHGVQEVPMSAFQTVGKPKYRNAQEEKRTKELARQIQENKELNPLIVVKDAEGHYILEGGHRFDALRELDIDSFPALMVHDLESLADVAIPAVAKAHGGALKKLQFMDDGGIASPEENITSDQKPNRFSRVASEMYDEYKQSLANDYERLKASAVARAQLAKIAAAQLAGGSLDFASMVTPLVNSDALLSAFPMARAAKIGLTGSPSTGRRTSVLSDEKTPYSLADYTNDINGNPIGGSEDIIKRAQKSGLLYGGTRMMYDAQEPDPSKEMLTMTPKEYGKWLNSEGRNRIDFGEQITTGRFSPVAEIGASILGGSLGSKLASGAINTGQKFKKGFDRGYARAKARNAPPFLRELEYAPGKKRGGLTQLKAR